MSHDVADRRGSLQLRATLAVLALAQLLITLDINIIAVALPDIAKVGFSPESLQWVVSGYTIAFGGFLLLGGRTADLIGRRRMLVFALGLLAVASLVGGFSSNAAAIVAARAVQGLAGALLFPAVLSLITTLFKEGPQRNHAIAIWGGAGASGLTVGALLGGLLTGWLGWRAVFFINVPVAVVLVVGALLTIPISPLSSTQRAGRSFDLPGALAVTAGSSLLVYVLVKGPEVGWTSLRTALGAVVAIGLLVLFIIIEHRSKDPLMPLRLLGVRSLSSMMVISFILLGTFGSLSYLLTILFQRVQGYSALLTGLAFLVPSLAIAVGTQLSERLISRGVSARLTILVGLLVGAAGIGILALGVSDSHAYAPLLPGLIVYGVGQGTAWTAMWVIGASDVVPQEQGIGSSMISSAMQVGLAIGLAVLVGISNSKIGGLTGEPLRVAMADGTRVAIWFAAAGAVVGFVVALIFVPRRQAASGDVEPVSSLEDSRLDIANPA